jgi:hypothetical protein
MSVPHPIPYQGSKRALASAILAYLPEDCVTLIEPFAGSAALSLADLYHKPLGAGHTARSPGQHDRVTLSLSSPRRAIGEAFRKRGFLLGIASICQNR